MRCAVALLCVGGTTAIGAQPTIDDLREELRGNLRSVEFAKSVASLVQLSDDIEFSGARYEIDNEEGTTISLLSLPGSRSFDVFGDSMVALRTEGVVAIANAGEDNADIFDGMLPGSEASVESNFTTVSGLIGLGPEIEPIEGLRFAALTNVSIAYVNNSADYGGPGAPLAAAIVDGIGLNWDSWVGGLGVAARGQWDRPLPNDLRSSFAARYDVRWVETLRSDDDAQDFSTTLQYVTARADLFGPTPLTLAGGDIEWQAFAGVKQFTEGDLFGVRRFFQVGAGLRLVDALPLGGIASAKAVAIIGNDLTGFSVGLSLGF